MLDGNYFYYWTAKALKVAQKDDITREKISTIKDILAAMFDPVNGLEVKDRKWHLKTYRECFVGTSIICDHLTDQ